jgi:hemolysin III
MFERLRDPVSGLTHLFAAILSLAGLIFLLVLAWGDKGRVASLAIYGASLVLLFSASATYHMVKGREELIEALRKFDHAAIYLLIAGSYTPLCWNIFTGFWKWGLLGIIWGMAIIGIIVKMFIIRAPRWVSAGIYLLMGWLAILGLKEILSTLPAGAIAWLAAGGIIYTLGAVVYITKKLDFIHGKFGFHEVWHIFVMLGALAHYILIAAYVAPLR